MKTFIWHFPLYTCYLKTAVLCEVKRKVPRYNFTFVTRASCCLSHQRGSANREAQITWKHRYNSKHYTALYIAEGCKFLNHLRYNSGLCYLHLLSHRSQFHAYLPQHIVLEYPYAKPLGHGAPKFLSMICGPCDNSKYKKDEILINKIQARNIC